MTDFYKERLKQAKIEYLALTRCLLQLGLVHYSIISEVDGVTDPGSTINLMLRHYQLSDDLVQLTPEQDGMLPNLGDAAPITGITFLAVDVNSKSRPGADSRIQIINDWVRSNDQVNNNNWDGAECVMLPDEYVSNSNRIEGRKWRQEEEIEDGFESDSNASSDDEDSRVYGSSALDKVRALRNSGSIPFHPSTPPMAPICELGRVESKFETRVKVKFLTRIRPNLNPNLNPTLNYRSRSSLCQIKRGLNSKQR